MSSAKSQNKRPVTILLVGGVIAAIVAFSLTGKLAHFFFIVTNFCWFLALVRYVHDSQIAPVLRARSVEVKDRIEKIQHDLGEVREHCSILSERLQNIEHEQTQAVQSYRAEGVAMGQTILENSRRAAERIKADAERQVASELARSKSELRDQAISAALIAAREQLAKQVSPEQDKQLRMEMLKEAFR